MHLGGLAGVTAAVFSKLGGKAAFIGQLGEDRFGDLF
jgi:sugar/nucleoside kinase (ribokinase family)